MHDVRSGDAVHGARVRRPAPPRLPWAVLVARHPLLRILEINPAGQLTQFLRAFPAHTLAEYPQVDIHHLPYGDGHFDLVLHSDTLEHVPDPRRAIAECLRVTKPGGCVAFTVPIVHAA